MNYLSRPVASELPGVYNESVLIQSYIEGGTE